MTNLIIGSGGGGGKGGGGGGRTPTEARDNLDSKQFAKVIKAAPRTILPTFPPAPPTTGMIDISL